MSETPASGRTLHIGGAPTSGRTLVMGIVNVTPDSFSDGGRYLRPEAAIAHGHALLAAGADLVDVGGESTRPGAERVSEAEELDRVLPVVSALAASGARVSVDTMRASVAKAAVSAGASIVNDVSGGLADPQMVPTMAELDADYCVMHWRGFGDQMNARAIYSDVVAEVLAELSDRVQAVVAAGVPARRIILDPGFGFAKDADHNWDLLRGLDRFTDLGYRLLVGVSRKRFLGALLAEGGEPRPADQRDAASVAVTTWAAEHGAWAVRTHTARDHRDAVDVVARLRNLDPNA